jgi:hypothetical protein
MTKDEKLKLALDDLIAEYHMETSSFAKRVDEIFKQALAAPVQEQVLGFDVVLDESLPPNTMKFVQPAPVQEPVGTYGEIFESMLSLLRTGLQRDQQIYMAMKDKPLYTTPPAQPAPVQEPVAQGSKEHLKIMMEEIAWEGRLELSDALANIDEFYTTPPAAQRQWVEVEQIKWDGDKFIAKLKENT